MRIYTISLDDDATSYFKILAQLDSQHFRPILADLADDTAGPPGRTLLLHYFDMVPGANFSHFDDQLARVK